MNEVYGEVFGARKRGRYDTQQDDKPDQQKKNRATCLPSGLSIFESLESEEDDVYDIDEEPIYNLMRELMEEIGMLSDPPLPPPLLATLPFQGSSEISNSASSSTNCSSSSKHVSVEIELPKTVVDKADWGDCDREEGFSDVFGAGGFLVNDSCICNLNRAFSGDEFSQLNVVVSSDMNSNSDLSEIENWALSITSVPQQANSLNESTR